MKMKLLMTIFLVTSIFFNSNAEEYPPSITITGNTTACTEEVYSYSVVNDPTVYYQWTITNGAFITSPTGSHEVDVAWYGSGTITASTYSDPAFTMLINTTSLSVSVDLLSPYITMDPEVGCLDEKPHHQEPGNHPDKYENDCHKACESNKIKYFANGNAGSTFEWEIIGDGTPFGPLMAPTLIVEWNSVGFGVLRLTETSQNGCVEVTEICIEIIPKPIAEFDVLPGLTVCVGQTVYFEDLSQAVGDADLTAWEWSVSDGTFQAYTESTDFSHVFNTGGNYSVNLRVYNTCGCYDDYKVKIKVIAEPGPDIYCPKVVCPNEKTVLSTNSNCGTYFWAVTNGTIVSGIGTSSITVMWDDVPSGVGYVELAVPCGDCNIPTVLEIPIVSTSLDIDGPLEVCLGDQVTLTAPMIPGTFYDWSVTPSPGGAIVVEEIHNQVIIQVNGVTPITVEVEYFNELAGCGDGCGGNSTHTMIAVAPSNVTGVDNVCVGDSETYTISGPATGTIGVERPNGTTTNISNGSNYTFTMDGLHILTPNNAGCQGPPLLVNAHANPAPPDSITGPDNVCPGIPYEYQAHNDVDGTIYAWTVTGGTPSTGVGENITVTWVSTPYILEVKRINIQTPNCESTSISDTINPLVINPAYDISHDTVCANHSYTYSLDYDDGEEYYWTIVAEGQGSVITDQNSPTVDILWNNTTGTAVVTAFVRKCNLWYDVPMNVTISPATAVNFTVSEDTICQNEDVNFIADSGYDIYSWSIDPAVTPSTMTGPTPSQTFYDAGSFNVTLIATDECGNVSMHSEIITVLPEPPSQLSIISNTLVCSGGVVVSGSATLVTSIIGGTAGHSFEWKKNGSILIGQVNSTLLITDTGLYTVTVTNDVTGCTAVETIKVKCPTGPACTMPLANDGNFTFAYDNTTCGEVDFTEGTVTTAAGWTYLGGTYIHNILPNIINAPGPNYTYSSFDEAGYYNVTYKLCYEENISGDVCCKNVTETVPIPVVAEAEATAFCDGNGALMIQLDDFSSSVGNLVGGYDATWIIDGTPEPLMSGVTSASTSIPTSLAPGTYTVVLKVFVPITGAPGMPSNYECEFATTVDIPVLPDATFTNNSLVCEDLDVEFVAIPGFTTYHWTFGDGASLIQTTNTASRKYDGPMAGAYNVVLTVTNSAGCTDTYTDTANVVTNNFDMPVIDVSPTTLICKPNPAILTFNHSGSATATSWDWSDGAMVNPHAVFDAGGYIVTVADTYGCEAVTALTPVDIRPAPNAVIFGEVSYCFDDDLPVELFGYAGPGFNYVWRKKASGGSFAFFDNTENITDNSVTTSGSPYEYELTVTDPLTGCSSTTIQVVEIHTPPPSPGINNNVVNCNPYTVNLQATTGVTPAYFNWSNGDTGASVNVMHGGLFEVTLTDGNGCTSTRLVDIEGEPNLDFFPVGCYVYCREDMPLLFPGPYGNFDNWRFYFDDGSGPAVIANGSGPITNLSITDEGDYWIEVNDNGCTFTTGIMNVKFDEKKCKEVCKEPCDIKVGKIYPEHILDCMYEFTVDVYLGKCTKIIDYKWTINNVPVPGGAVMSYVFPGPGGGYKICVEVIGEDDFGNQCSDKVCIDFKPTCKCDCDIEADFDIIQENCEFYFISDVEVSKCTKIKKYVWTIYQNGQVYDQISGPANLSYGFNSQKPFEVCLTVYGSDGTTQCKDTFCKNIFPCNQGSSFDGNNNTNSRDKLDSPTIAISPNPFTSSIRIQSEGSIGKEWHIVIIDVTGRLISNNTVTVEEPYLIMLTDGWRSGMYQIYISDELGNSFAEKIIKVE